MRYITGIKKYLFLLKALNKEIIGLPLDFFIFMIKNMRCEKLSLHANRIFINSFYTPFPSESYITGLRCFKRLSRGQMSLFSAYISVTDRCHLNCWHCGNIKKRQPNQELSYNQLKKVINELQDAGVACIGFTGGEPSLRDDLEQLVKAVDRRSYSILFTSGHLIDYARAVALKKAGLDVMIISLDSHIKEEHNKKRGTSTAFDEAVEAIKNSVKAGIYTAAAIVITKDMIYSNKIYEFINYVDDLGADEVRILEPKPCGKLLNSKFNPLSEKDKAEIKRLQHNINKDRKLPKIASLTHISSKENYGCSAGRIHIYINASGDVYPCDFSPLSFGNILKESVVDIYARMNKVFNRPSSSCFILSIYPYLIREGIDNLPIRDNDKIRYLLSKVEASSIPRLFRTLGLKED